MPVNVRKRDGTLEPFNVHKLRRSLERSGADAGMADAVIAKAKGILYDGMPTHDLYAFVFRELKRRHPATSARYNLKQAILALGHEGYVFERYIGELYKAKGYDVQLNQEVRGQFIPHEIDVIATRGKESLMVECKHHAKPWLGCDIQTALYVYARFLDVRAHFTAPALVTNTKFSGQVLDYARGVGLQLTGWSYPHNDGLEANIERYKLYPITMLHGVDSAVAGACFRAGIVTAHDLCAAGGAGALAKKLRLPADKVRKLLDLTGQVCP